jgi:hypothetical protein
MIGSPAAAAADAAKKIKPIIATFLPFGIRD